MLILTLNIHITQVLETRSVSGIARMILFDGTADGPCFHGTILPGGVDTQREMPDRTGTLSARYMLQGTDEKGCPCRIFIENSAILGHEETRPVLLTDSKALSWLEKAMLKGHILSEEGTLKILIETVE